MRAMQNQLRTHAGHGRQLKFHAEATMPSGFRWLACGASAIGMILALAHSTQAQSPAAPINPSVVMPDPRVASMDPITKSPVDGVIPGRPKPAYPTSAREVRTFTSEVVYNFAHYSYTPTVPVQPVSRAGADLKTPEGALVAILSAMQQKDYEWFLASWDKKSATDIRDLDAQNGGADATRKQWQDMFVGRRIEITERIESGLYVAILFRTYQPGIAKAEMSTAMVFKQDGMHWVATNEAEMTNAFVVLHGGETSKETRSGFVTPLVNGTGYLDDGEPNPEDIAQTEFLRQYPKGKNTATRVMQ